MTDFAAEFAQTKTRATALIPFLRERAADIDALGHLPDDVVLALHDAGVYRIAEPAEYGGGGLGPVPMRDFTEVVMEVGKGNGSAAWSVYINITPVLLKAWSDEVAREVLTGPHIGPRMAGTTLQTKGTAEGRVVDGGYLVKGSWKFPSNVWHCAWFMGNFDYIDLEGNPQIAMALIPREDIEIEDDWHVEGLKGSGSNTTHTATEVFVPAERTITHAEMVAAMSGYLLVAVHLAACSLVVGCARGALETFIELAPRRPGWRGSGSLASMSSTQIAVAKLRAQTDLAELAVRRQAERFDEAAAAGMSVPAEEMALLRYANTHVVHQVRQALEELAIIVGSAGAANGHPMTRFLRDARVACLHGVLRPEPEGEECGKVLLGLSDGIRVAMSAKS